MKKRVGKPGKALYVEWAEPNWLQRLGETQLTTQN
jgi:hypothetical protein